MSDIDLEITVPSRGRAGTIMRDTLSIFPAARVFCYEPEFEVYRSAGVRNLSTYPAHLPGLASIRNHILRQSSADVCVRIDDDAKNFACLVGRSVRRTNDPEFVTAVLKQTASVAKQIGTNLFGYAKTTDPATFNSFRPFRFTSFPTSALGIIGREQWFDESIQFKQDVDFTLQTLMKYRIVLIDLRFAFDFQFWSNDGGCTITRSVEAEWACIDKLRRKWGSDTIHVGGKRGSSHGAATKHLSIHVER